jgi:hypothetical protein
MWHGEDFCWRCDGTGVYSSRTLYEHHLRIGDHDFSLHSYVRPATVSNAPGADLPSYGGRFTTQDLRGLPPLRLADYLRVGEEKLGAQAAGAVAAVAG